MVVTEVTNQSWGGRIKESIKGFIIGLGLFAFAFPVLWMNEGRAVKTEKSLKEGQGAVISVPPDTVSAANEHKLVHMSGKATTAEVLADPEFLVSQNAIKLRRKVEMYQWKEKKESKERKKLGGGTETVTTYSYDKTWSDEPINSADFKESGHDNPGALPFQSSEQTANKVTLGAFTLSPTLVGKMTDYEKVPVDDKSLAALPKEMKSKLKLADGSFYMGENAATPAIGDARVTFSAVTPADVSVVAQQEHGSFAPYKAQAGVDIEMLRRGIVGAQQMFEMALKENTILTWILRAVGFIMMFIGLALFFRPLSVLGDVVPMFGSVLAFGTGLAAFSVAAVLSVGTIGVAWIVYRPVLGIALLAVAIGLLAWLAVSGKKRAAAKALGQPQTV
ncbi:MAG: TMEM43 family protein [Thermoanaerobaculia bacterium]